jgi:hypothetical protein
MLTHPLLQEYRRHLSIDYEPLRIILYLESPVAFIGYLTFDGFLSRLVWEDILGEDAFNQSDILDDVYDIPLPIQEIGNKKKFFVCSIAQHQGKEQKTNWLKMESSPLDMDPDRTPRRVPWSTDMRYSMPLIIVNTQALLFLVHGIKSEIWRLLSTATHIGKKASQGYGKIKNFSIESFPYLAQVIQDQDNEVLRPIPIEELDLLPMPIKLVHGKNRRFQKIGYRPPYWHPLNQTRCLLPKGIYDF